MADDYQNPYNQPQQQGYQPADPYNQQPRQPQQAYQQPYQQPYQQQPVQPQQPYQQPQQYPGQQPKNATTLIVLSVLEILFCGGLLAIIPLIFAIQANSAYNMGDIAGGDAKAKTAKTALIIILVVGIVATIAFVALGGFAMIQGGSVR